MKSSTPVTAKLYAFCNTLVHEGPFSKSYWLKFNSGSPMIFRRQLQSPCTNIDRATARRRLTSQNNYGRQRNDRVPPKCSLLKIACTFILILHASAASHALTLGSLPETSLTTLDEVEHNLSSRDPEADIDSTTTREIKYIGGVIPGQVISGGYGDEYVLQHRIYSIGNDGVDASENGKQKQQKNAQSPSSSTPEYYDMQQSGMRTSSRAHGILSTEHRGSLMIKQLFPEYADYLFDQADAVVRIEADKHERITTDVDQYGQFICVYTPNSEQPPMATAVDLFVPQRLSLPMSQEWDITRTSALPYDDRPRSEQELPYLSASRDYLHDSIKGKYRLRRRFGLGGQGEVWHATRIKRRNESQTNRNKGSEKNNTNVETRSDNHMSKGNNQQKQNKLDGRMLMDNPRADAVNEGLQLREIQQGYRESDDSLGIGKLNRNDLNSDENGKSGEGEDKEEEEEKEGGNQERERFVLKRIFVERGHEQLLSGIREAYFGNLLKGTPHVSRFVESFNRTRAHTQARAPTTDAPNATKTPSSTQPEPNTLSVKQLPALESRRDDDINNYGDSGRKKYETAENNGSKKNTNEDGDAGLGNDDVVELWLVFHDEGTSLNNLLYATTEIGGAVVVEPSAFWYDTRMAHESKQQQQQQPRGGARPSFSARGARNSRRHTATRNTDSRAGRHSGQNNGIDSRAYEETTGDKEQDHAEQDQEPLVGAHVRREAIQQILRGLVELAKFNISHRDIKPSNLFLNIDGNNNKNSNSNNNRRNDNNNNNDHTDDKEIRLGDFGSSVDIDAVMQGMYEKAGPTQMQETREYEPPEAIFTRGVPDVQFPYFASRAYRASASSASSPPSSSLATYPTPHHEPQQQPQQEQQRNSNSGSGSEESQQGRQQHHQQDQQQPGLLASFSTHSPTIYSPSTQHSNTIPIDTNSAHAPHKTSELHHSQQKHKHVHGPNCNHDQQQQHDDVPHHKRPHADEDGIDSRKELGHGDATPDEQQHSSAAASRVSVYAYDMWSTGVVALELLLGTSQIFTLDDRTRILLERKLRRSGMTDARLIEQALMAAALADFGISPMQDPHDFEAMLVTRRKHEKKQIVKRKGSGMFEGDENQEESRHRHMVETFNASVVAHDPFGRGFYDDRQLGELELRFVWRLLQWSPFERLTPQEALDHAYFHGELYKCPKCGAEFELPSELNEHFCDDVTRNNNNRYTQSQTGNEGDSDNDYFAEKFNNREIATRLYQQQHDFVDQHKPISNLITLSSTKAQHDEYSLGSVFVNPATSKVAGYSSSLVLKSEVAVDDGPMRFTMRKDATSGLVFHCPKCKRKFTVWESCNQHVQKRKHDQNLAAGVSCMFNHSLLPRCVSRTQLSVHDELGQTSHIYDEIAWSERTSKWCGIAGRRPYIEDFSSQGYVDIGKENRRTTSLLDNNNNTTTNNKTSLGSEHTSVNTSTHLNGNINTNTNISTNINLKVKGKGKVNSKTNTNGLVCLATTVVDGHLGTVSARYVASYMLRHLAKAAAAVPVPTVPYSNPNSTNDGSTFYDSSTNTAAPESVTNRGPHSHSRDGHKSRSETHHEDVDSRIGGRRHRQVITTAFHSLQARLGASLNDTSGATVTLALLCATGEEDNSATSGGPPKSVPERRVQRTLMLAHVGDSRAVACCAKKHNDSDGAGADGMGSAGTSAHAAADTDVGTGGVDRLDRAAVAIAGDGVDTGGTDIYRSTKDSQSGGSTSSSSGGGEDDTHFSIGVIATVDHLPSDPKERERIERQGGFVTIGDAHSKSRVMGRLAVSRSLGDNPDRQYLSSIPDITVIHLDEPDNFDAQFVVIASDGLWDVISNEEVVRIVRSVQRRRLADLHSAHHEGEGSFGKDPASGKAYDRGWVAAAVVELTHEAYVRSSMDNIGVFIVPLNLP